MSEISPLCDRCQVLRFDDKENGGTIKTSPTGEDYVSFGPNQRILLDYDLEDEFPDLPILSASSSRCALCSVIKDKILAFKGVMYPDSTNLIIHRFALFFQERIDLETDPDDPTGLLLDRFQVFFKLRGWHAVPDSDSDTDSSNETISGNDPESTTESSHVLQFGIYANPTGEFAQIACISG
ncbi:hypothetical protein N7456_012163 [Penicillium angulare]|uniref:Uncharacterized protein n=1 Tax=Penicillium angulare TaxID=116970 RepID=A0A9W9K1F0_9EURO|nr:hypothetical protein N7456_012163 [Penicillium angulare]